MSIVPLHYVCCRTVVCVSSSCVLPTLLLYPATVLRYPAMSAVVLSEAYDITTSYAAPYGGSSYPSSAAWYKTRLSSYAMSVTEQRIRPIILRVPSTGCYQKLWLYALAMRCPVLTCAVLLLRAIVICVCYVMFGTDLGYAATRRAVAYERRSH
eukprot:516714-Rhodomonas_salina.3